MEGLETLLRSEGGVRASEVKGKMQRFEASVRELKKYVEERLRGLRGDCDKLLQRVSEWLEKLQQYSPEEYLKESEKEKLLDKELPRWRGLLKSIAAAWRWEDLLTLLEFLRGEIGRGDLNWSLVNERLLGLRGRFVTLAETYSNCEYAQKLVASFEATLEEAETRSGKLSQSDRDRLVGLLDEWREDVRTVLSYCKPEIEEIPGEEEGAIEKERKGLLVSLLCFEIAGERYCVEATQHRRLIVGRYDPGGRDPVIQGAASDGLKILEGGSVLYVFNGVECRWGCIEPDRDCTHREHVEVEVEEGVAAVRMAEGAVLPVHYGFAPEERKLLRRTDAVFLKPGRRLYLWISGVYLDARRKREQVPLMLSLELRRGRVTIFPR
ncbi:MAG: hypothetical protein LM563_04375 [Thermofilum sp.]|nr:hypothetical protein [Thermofilum sp.]